MTRVLVFGGTSEGREIVEWLAGRGCDVVSYAATEYGGSLVVAGEHVDSRVGPLPEGEMEELMADGGFSCVVDATHPFATHITEHVSRAAREAGLPYLRLVREAEPEGPWTGCADVAGAARLLVEVPGRVLLTTGVKDLAAFTGALPDFAERLFVRVLPVASSIERAHALGIPTGHLIAMQGPFSQQLNAALIREFGISALVTKASGTAGGFWEKIGACRECGIEAIVVHRPTRETGLSLDGAKRELEEDYGI